MIDAEVLDDAITALLARPLPDRVGGAFADTVLPPSRGQRRACYLALEAARIALDAPAPLAVLEEAMDAVVGGRRRCDRVKALGYAHEILRRLPAGTMLLASEVEDAAGSLSPAEASLQLPSHPRLAVRTPAGRVWLVEAHPATHSGGTVDSWMSARVAAHNALGRHLAEFVGVVVFTGRCPSLSVHAVAETRHVLGGCADCAEVAR